MGISWMTVLAAVPWTEVIRNAPKVAEGAKKLWNTVGSKKGQASTDLAAARNSSDPEVRVAALEVIVDELSRQMQASAELIKALAEQNTQLVERIELNRRRMIRLSIIVMLLIAGMLFLAAR